MNKRGIGILMVFLLAAAGKASDQIEALQKKVDQGLYLEAIQEARSYLGQQASPELYAFLASVYLRLGKYEEAFLVVSEGLRSFPKDPDLSALKNQIIQARQDDYRKKLTRWEEALRLNPKNPDLLLRVARAYRALGNPQTAVKRYRQVMDLGIRDFAVRKELAFTLLEAQQYREAAQMLERLWAEQPEDLSLLLNLGWCKLRLNERTEAEQIFQLCLSYRPGWPEALQGLQALRKKTQKEPKQPPKPKEPPEVRRDREIARLKAHLRQHPEDAQAHFRLGTLLYQVGDFKGSADHLRAYLKAHPKDYEARKRLAFVLSWDGRFREAADLFAELHQEHPQDQEVLLALARNLSWSAQFSEAARVFRVYLRSVPQDPLALMAMGLNFLWWRQFDSAEVYLRKAAEIDPNNPDIQEGLQLAFTARKKAESARIDSLWERADDALEKGNLGLALRLYREYLKYRPQDRNARITYGKILYWTGQERKAIDEVLFPLLEKQPEDYALLRLISSLLKSLDDTAFTLPRYRRLLRFTGRTNHPDAQVLFDLAEHHLRYGDPDEAAEIYEEILSQAPGSYTAREGLEKARRKKQESPVAHWETSSPESPQVATRFQQIQDIDGFTRSTWGMERIQTLGKWGQFVLKATRRSYRSKEKERRTEDLWLGFMSPQLWNGRLRITAQGGFRRIGSIHSLNYSFSASLRKLLGFLDLKLGYSKTDMADQVNMLGFGTACAHLLRFEGQAIRFHGFNLSGALQALALSDSNAAWSARFQIAYPLSSNFTLGYQVWNLHFLRSSPLYWSPQSYRYTETFLSVHGSLRDRAYFGTNLRIGLAEGAPRPIRSLDGYLAMSPLPSLQVEGSFGFSQIWTPQKGYQNYRTFSIGVRFNR